MGVCTCVFERDRGWERERGGGGEGQRGGGRGCERERGERNCMSVSQMYLVGKTLNVSHIHSDFVCLFVLFFVCLFVFR